MIAPASFAASLGCGCVPQAARVDDDALAHASIDAPPMEASSPGASVPAPPSPPGRAAVRALLLALLIGTLAPLAPSTAQAQVAGDTAPLVFRDRAEEDRFHALVAELRCVMCQNQSLADSNAQIARDLRREVLVLMRDGRSDAEVREFLVQRYGEFVLYRPAVSAHTWLLWFGPLLALAGGGLALALLVRRRARSTPPPTQDEPQEW